MIDWERIGEEPDRERRLESILVDAYDESEQLWAFYTYWEEHAEFPFEAVPRSEVLNASDEDVDTMPDAQPVEVLKVADATESRGVLCQVMRKDKVRQMPISELVPLDSHNRRVWGDYMEWFEGVLGGGRSEPGEDDLEDDSDEEDLEEDEE
jgi:hypothetical protein